MPHITLYYFDLRFFVQQVGTLEEGTILPYVPNFAPISRKMCAKK